jgi:isoleucyl-tRNA synthetase
MAPILVHVSEEVWQALPNARERYASVHLAPFPRSPRQVAQPAARRELVAPAGTP